MAARYPFQYPNTPKVPLEGLRSSSANFAAEIWEGLGYKDVASVFTASEAPVAVIALAALAATMVIKDNQRGVYASVQVGF